MTFTPRVINNAESAIFLVAGKDKAEALREILEGASAPEQYPAQTIRPANRKLIWMIDEAAARLISPRRTKTAKS